MKLASTLAALAFLGTSAVAWSTTPEYILLMMVGTSEGGFVSQVPTPVRIRRK
jgi:hypothetical protein